MELLSHTERREFSSLTIWVGMVAADPVYARQFIALSLSLSSEPLKSNQVRLTFPGDCERVVMSRSTGMKWQRLFQDSVSNFPYPDASLLLLIRIGHHLLLSAERNSRCGSKV